MQKSAKLQCPRDATFKFNLYMCVGIEAIVGAQLVPDALLERVSVRAATLKRVADASIEVVVAFPVAPEWNAARGEDVVGEFCNRAVEALHHATQVFSNAEEAERVVMVA